MSIIAYCSTLLALLVYILEVCEESRASSTPNSITCYCISPSAKTPPFNSLFSKITADNHSSKKKLKINSPIVTVFFINSYEQMANMPIISKMYCPCRCLLPK